MVWLMLDLQMGARGLSSRPLSFVYQVNTSVLLFRCFKIFFFSIVCFNVHGLLLKTPQSKESMTVITDYEGNENNIIDGVVNHLLSCLGVA